MTPDRWQQIDQIFHGALECAPAERAAFIGAACGGDELLKNEIENLLRFHEQSDSFIEATAAEVAAELLDGEVAGFATGQTVGPYQIAELLGRGGMGQVYLGTDTRLGRPVALKVLPKQFTIDPERVRRFELEARAASALNHPNIVTIYEIGSANGTQFIVTEFVQGRTLRELMNEQPFTVNEALNVAIQVAGALHAAHAAGIVHRDIKPENIMLRGDGYVKILDFGLAKLTESISTESDLETSTLLQSNPGLVMGTVQYMSPEQARGKKVDARTDIWALGIVLYELLAGRVPFTGDTPSHVMVSLMESEPPTLRDQVSVPDELDQIVTRALRKDKKQRYQTAREMAHDLKGLKQELQLEARLRNSGEHLPAARRLPIVEGSKQTKAAIAAGIPTADQSLAHPTSSAEYIVTEIKRHKRGAVFGSLVFMLVLAVTAYFSYFHHAAGSDAIDSLAVLPFVNANNDPKAANLSDGLSDSIIESLSHLPNFRRIVPLSSVMRFKDKQSDPQTLGRELNVQSVLTGSLTQHGDDLVITAELIDVKDNKRLLSREYKDKLANMGNLQSQIVQEISARLRLTLTAQQQERIAKSATQNSEAQNLYLQGLYFLHRPTDESHLKSGEYFRQAIDKDPNFALAYTGLANFYGGTASYGNFPPNENWPKSEEAAVKALIIDDTLAEAHAALGNVRMWYDWDWVDAEKEMKRAIELNPEVPNFYTWLLEANGRFDEEMAEIKRRRAIDPNSVPDRSAAILYYTGRYDEAIAEWQKRLESNRILNGSDPHLALGEIYLKQGQSEKALEEMIKARSRVKQPRDWARIGRVYAAAGKRDEAIKILDEIKGLTEQRYNLWSHIAAIYAALGDKDQAFKSLTKAFDEHESEAVLFNVDPRFETLRSDPRFTDLLRRVRLAP